MLACHHLIGADAPARTLALTSLKAAPAPWRGFRNKFFVVCFFIIILIALARACTWLTFARPLTLVFFFDDLDLGLSHLCYLDLKVLIFYTYIHEQTEWRSG